MAHRVRARGPGARYKAARDAPAVRDAHLPAWAWPMARASHTPAWAPRGPWRAQKGAGFRIVASSNKIRRTSKTRQYLQSLSIARTQGEWYLLKVGQAC